MKIRSAVLPILIIVFCWFGFLGFTGFAAPRPPQPPWPQSTLKIFGFDSPYQKVPWRDVAFNEEESTLVESWSGYALERSGLFLSPIVIPVRGSDKEVNLDPTRGSIRFWLAPNWSTANEKSGGAGPGHLAHLLELVNLGGKASDARWALFLNEAGDTLHFVGQTKLGLTELLKVPVTFTAGDWRMITLCYSETNSAILLDNQIIATGEGVMAPAVWEEKDLGLVIGSDILAASDSLAEAQFEELTTMRQWPGKSDWQALYFQATKRRSLLGALGTKEEEQAKVELFKAAGLLPEDYGLAKNSGEGDGPIVANSYAEGSLWLEITGITNGLAALIVHGTTADVAYEILSKASLTNAAWAGEQVILGAGGQDWTPTIVPVGTRTNHLFFWARTLVDTDGDGLPDWWELDHGLDPNNPDTGNTGVSDGYKDSDNDGWNNLQEYQNGTNPSQFNTPAAPSGLQITLSSGGSVATVRWHPSSGPVTGYTLERSFTNQALQVSANATQVTDSGVVFPTWLYSEFEAPQYRLRANYAGGASAWTTWLIPPECRAPSVQTISSSGGTLMAAPGLGDAAALRVGEYDYDNEGYPVSLTNVDISASSFVNGFAAAPVPFSGDFVQQGYAQSVSSNGVPSAWAYQSWGQSPPFWDGRAQLKDNLRFLLRVATPNGSFGYWYHELGYAPYFMGNPTNYAFAGFYDVNENPSDGTPHASTRELLPFEENYLYRNFVFSSTNLDVSGSIKTGVYWNYGLMLLAPEQSIFHPPATVSPIPSVLTSGESQWTVWGNAFPSPTGLVDWGLGVSVQSGQYHMTSGARNLFGLPYVSFKLARGSNATSVATLSTSVNVVTNSADAQRYFYPETAQPAFQTVDYYFTRQYGDWSEHTNEARLPGHATFSPTNTSPLLITSFDAPSFRLAGYAKLAVTNGYAGVYGYLGQYFDKAYKITNGVVTTNQTGILSPYGEFFPTEPGRVALVTMPDLDTGARGTATVHVVKLQLDVNHDGTIDRTFAGPDNTSQNSPFRFWANNDRDEIGTGGKLDYDVPLPVNVTNTDYSFGQIRTRRNLKDFARLWISGMPTFPTNQGYSVQIGWSQIVSGSPKIRLYWASETNGGIGYLTNTALAAQQIAQYNLPIGEITSANSLNLPISSFTDGLSRHFLFEAGASGKGVLTLTISKGSNVVAQTSAWLDLHDIKDLYEQAAVVNVLQNWPEMVQQPMTSTAQIVSLPTVDTAETKQLAAFVHGWRMTYADYIRFSQTMFKRLYWQGYRGRFAAVRWQTLSASTELFNGLDFATYNRSEHIAFKSGSGAAAYFNNLRQRFPDYTISVCSHSMGGIVVMQTLKELAGSGHQPLDNLILMQAAVPAHCFDPNAVSYQLFLNGEQLAPTPDIYRNYAASVTNALRGSGRIINFFNPLDFALTTWRINQALYITNLLGNGVVTMKPNTTLGYYTDGVNSLLRTNVWNQSFASILYGGYYGNGPTRAVTSVHELMPFVARPRSEAVGSLAGVYGQIQGQELNLQTQLGFTDNPDDHSGQFNRSIQESQIWQFYFRLKTNLFSLP